MFSFQASFVFDCLCVTIVSNVCSEDFFFCKTTEKCHSPDVVQPIVEKLQSGQWEHWNSNQCCSKIVLRFGGLFCTPVPKYIIWCYLNLDGPTATPLLSTTTAHPPIVPNSTDSLSAHVGVVLLSDGMMASFCCLCMPCLRQHPNQIFLLRVTGDDVNVCPRRNWSSKGQIRSKGPGGESGLYQRYRGYIQTEPRP